MIPHNPLLNIARESMRMGDEHSNKTFQMMAMVSMGVVATAAAGQLFIELIKALNHKERHRAEGRETQRSWQEREHERRAVQTRGRER